MTNKSPQILFITTYDLSLSSLRERLSKIHGIRVLIRLLQNEVAFFDTTALPHGAWTKSFITAPSS